MITHRTGSIFDSGAAVLVNPVNCVGVSGKGLALKFKKRFTLQQTIYERDCKARRLLVGHIWPVVDSQCRGIIYLATKGHWRDRSYLEDVDAGIERLKWWCYDHDTESIAIPALGCGLGGLDWSDVLPLIKRSFAQLETRAMVYGPR